jgi:hypothetical protein
MSRGAVCSFIFIGILALFGAIACGAGQLMGPTLTPSPSVTLRVIKLPTSTSAFPRCSVFSPPPPNATVLATPRPRDTTIIENIGKVCFYINLPDELILINFPGCYYGGCTLIFERNASIEINQDASTIQIYSIFAVKDISHIQYSRGCACQEGCGGAGTLVFDIGILDGLNKGTYKVRLGEEELGEIEIPLDSSWCAESKEYQSWSQP